MCTQEKPFNKTCNCSTNRLFQLLLPNDCSHQNCTSSVPPSRGQLGRRSWLSPPFSCRHFYSTISGLSGQRMWWKYWPQGECKFVQLLWETLWEVPQKAKNRTVIWPINSITGYIQGKWNHYVQEKPTPPVNNHCCTVRNTWALPVRVNRLMNGTWEVVCVHTGILPGLTNWENPLICNNMGELGGYEVKCSKPGTEKYI